MAERNTPRRTGGIDYVGSYKVKASTTIEAGKIVLLDGNGLAVEGTTKVHDACVGRAEETVTAGETGDTFVRARMGIFRWKNHAMSTAARTNLGAKAYVADDETVAIAALDDSIAIGRIMEVDDAGVWVATGFLFQ